MSKLLNLFGIKRAIEPVFIVSGLPRSGTSLMMMILDAAGIPPLTDFERNADEDNPRGYYEFERVKKLKEGDFQWLENAQGKAVKVISALLTYLPEQYTYQVLFMRRALPEILASQRKMLINRGEDPNKVSDEDMARFFDQHVRKTLDWVKKQKNFSTLVVDYNQLVEDPSNEIHKINSFLGNHYNELLMINAIDPTLYRQRGN